MTVELIIDNIVVHAAVVSFTRTELRELVLFLAVIGYDQGVRVCLNPWDNKGNAHKEYLKKYPLAYALLERCLDVLEHRTAVFPRRVPPHVLVKQGMGFYPNRRAPPGAPPPAPRVTPSTPSTARPAARMAQLGAQHSAHTVTSVLQDSSASVVRCARGDWQRS